MSEVEMSRLLGEYTEVINRVLSRGGVFYFHPDYEDYRQELNLVLVQWMQKCPTLLHFLLDYPEERIYQRLLWFLLDLRRQSQASLRSGGSSGSGRGFSRYSKKCAASLGR